MEEWKTYKLGDLVNLFSGGTPNKGRADYWNGDIPWISAKSMYEDFLSSSDLFITESGLRAGSKLAQKGTILLLTRGSGLFNRIPICWTECGLAFNQDVKNIVSKDENVILNQFLFYWLYGNKTDISAILETTGIGAGKIDTERFLNMQINIPSISEQKQIIRAIEPIFSKIELNKRINHNLEEQALALYKSWFVDFDPFKGGKFVDSELGMIPEGWTVAPLGCIATISSGKRPPFKSTVQNEEYQIPVLGASSVMAYTSEYLIEGLYIITGRVGTLGELQRVKGKIWPSDNTLVISSDYYNFVYQVLREVDYSSLNRGSTQPLLTQSDLKSWPIVLPPEDVLNRFESCSLSLTSSILMNIEQNGVLRNVRDSILPVLMHDGINS